MIEIKGLTKTFGQTVALDNLDLHVPKGAVYGLVGPNGAGKSTLMRHIAGVYRQDSGEVLVGGQPVFENVEIKGRIGAVSSNLYYPTHATIRSLAKFYSGIYPSFNWDTFAALGKAFDLDANKPVRSFSKGMKKQAAFWLVLSLEPELLLLDEPLDGLDPLMRRQVWGLVMSAVADRGMTVLVSSHNLRELEGICDHLGVMDQGHMLRQFNLQNPEQGMVKVQIALADGAELPREVEVLHEKAQGKIRTLVVRGDAEELRRVLESAEPLLLEIMPLSLEELFLFEIGGAGHEIAQLLY